MELVFLALLVIIMIGALVSGFPVAFSLPGAAVITISLAALTGFMFEGNASAYFANDGPVEWLNAGVTNFRSLYWIVERDTLIAIPLFIFMGIMLQRSKVAEDLLVAMAKLFGPVPGGLGISVVFVGALLAATTGIVGATVIAMGLISLPAMLRNNYSKSLASGAICASGTLGQIIPPSIVLIILADQLSSAADQASTIRKQAYRTATGEFSMPSHLDVVSASAGDMFMGAFIPGLILVGLYMLYILVTAIIKPESAPPIPFEGKYDREFFKEVFIALVPPLALIFVVLGSILTGVATVNQAGAIGAMGAMLMGGYRLYEGRKWAYVPAIIAIISVVCIWLVLEFYTINIKNIRNEHDAMGVKLAVVSVTTLMIAILWSVWRTYKIDNTLKEVMIETAKTTSMVFIILLGAAMLTSAFRAFGGEELVKEYLTSLPGGFWTQFFVVMLVMFFLGFFLDFIEIAVVVVPIVAPILLADPSANITAVWFGVMVGLNIQTSFLTPPFGFALFYLRGVAPKEVKTTHIYKGAVAFIMLQLAGLGIAGYWPPLVNYLPFRSYLTSENAPPPINPRIQQCLREQVFDYYDGNKDSLLASISTMQSVDTAYLPERYQKQLDVALLKANETFAKVEAIEQAKANLTNAQSDYRPIHTQVRQLEKEARRVQAQIDEHEQKLHYYSTDEQVNEVLVEQMQAEIQELKITHSEILSKIPDEWESANKGYADLNKALDKVVREYNFNVDEAYAVIPELIGLLDNNKSAEQLVDQFDHYRLIIRDEPATAFNVLKAASREVGAIEGMSKIKSQIYKASKAMKGSSLKVEKALSSIDKAETLYNEEMKWRKVAVEKLLPPLQEYNNEIKSSIGMRLQTSLPKSVAKEIALCQSSHKDISLNF